MFLTRYEIQLNLIKTFRYDSITNENIQTKHFELEMSKRLQGNQNEMK